MKETVRRSSGAWAHEFTVHFPSGEGRVFEGSFYGSWRVFAISPKGEVTKALWVHGAQVWDSTPDAVEVSPEGEETLVGVFTPFEARTFPRGEDPDDQIWALETFPGARRALLRGEELENITRHCLDREWWEKMKASLVETFGPCKGREIAGLSKPRWSLELKEVAEEISSRLPRGMVHPEKGWKSVLFRAGMDRPEGLSVPRLEHAIKMASILSE